MNKPAAKNTSYDILGITPNASVDEIKKAFRLKALKLHPDRNPTNREGATRDMAIINAAYEDISRANAELLAYQKVVSDEIRALYVEKFKNKNAALGTLNGAALVLPKTDCYIDASIENVYIGCTMQRKISHTLFVPNWGDRVLEAILEITIEAGQLPDSILRFSRIAGAAEITDAIVLRLRVMPHPQYEIINGLLHYSIITDNVCALITKTITITLPDQKCIDVKVSLTALASRRMCVEKAGLPIADGRSDLVVVFKSNTPAKKTEKKPSRKQPDTPKKRPSIFRQNKSKKIKTDDL